MELTDRKKKVLRSIVDLYIRTAEPVGSKAIAELPDMNYSSATIRNEMAELTAMGYLEQPHTSAGRIPSPAGYRLYVDELMADYRLSMDEANSINSAIEEKMQRVDKMVEKVAKLVSQATDLPAISVASRQGSATVKRFDLILAGAGSFILVVMLSSDEVVNKLIKLPLNVGENERGGGKPGARDRGVHHRYPAAQRQHKHGGCRSGKAAASAGIPEHRQGTADDDHPGRGYAFQPAGSDAGCQRDQGPGRP